MKNTQELFSKKYRIEKKYNALFNSDYYEVCRTSFFSDTLIAQTLHHAECFEIIKNDSTRYVVNNAGDVVVV